MIDVSPDPPVALLSMKLLTIGERIAYARALLGLKQKELAVKVGVTAASVSQWENGDTKGLKPENLVAAAHALGVKTDWLAVGQEPMREEILTPQERVILENLRSMDEEERAAHQVLLSRRKGRAGAATGSQPANHPHA